MHGADVTWTGATITDWMIDTNWSNGTGPIQADVTLVASGTPIFSTGTTPAYNAIRQTGGTFTATGTGFLRWVR
jgi:hypothetical protein